MSMIGSLATLGYASQEVDAEALLQRVFLVNPHALLIDTRLHPFCKWNAQWQQENLKARYKGRYQFRGQWLGNVNHGQPGLAIKLANEQAGIDWLVTWLEKGMTLILLCACDSYQRCHRSYIYERVKERLGQQLPDYQLGHRVLTPSGVGTIDPSIPLEEHRARNRYAVILDFWTGKGPKPRYFFPHELQPYNFVQQSLLAS